MERLEAFRDLIRHGNTLLGEVVTYCREAEAAVAQFATEKAGIDALQAQLTEATTALAIAGEEVRRGEAALEAERAAAGALRVELETIRAQVGTLQRTQTQREKELERSLAEATTRQIRLQQEISSSRAAVVESRSLDARLAQLDGIEAKLRSTERELLETRQALEQERSRRDRAIALIRPKAVAEVRA